MPHPVFWLSVLTNRYKAKLLGLVLVVTKNTKYQIPNVVFLVRVITPSCELKFQRHGHKSHIVLFTLLIHNSSETNNVT